LVVLIQQVLNIMRVLIVKIRELPEHVHKPRVELNVVGLQVIIVVKLSMIRVLVYVILSLHQKNETVLIVVLERTMIFVLIVIKPQAVQMVASVGKNM